MNHRLWNNRKDADLSVFVDMYKQLFNNDHYLIRYKLNFIFFKEEFLWLIYIYLLIYLIYF